MHLLTYLLIVDIVCLILCRSSGHILTWLEVHPGLPSDENVRDHVTESAYLYHVATDKVPSIDGGKFQSIFSNNLQPIATHGKKAHGTLLVNKHCRNGGSVKRAPLSISFSGHHIGSSVVRTRGSAVPVLPLWCTLASCLIYAWALLAHPYST